VTIRMQSISVRSSPRCSDVIAIDPRGSTATKSVAQLPVQRVTACAFCTQGARSMISL